MKILYGLLALLLSSPLLAQNSYVANRSNATTPGLGGTLVGPYAGNDYFTGNGNTFIGGQAGYHTTSGAGNSFLGYGAGSANTTGGYNVFVGVAAGYNTMEANYNVFLGYAAGHDNTTGRNNVFVGGNTGYANTKGGDNAFVGYQAGQTNTTGTDNTFLGAYAGNGNTTGSLNSFVGSSAGMYNTTGKLNAFLGFATGESNTSGGENTFLGSLAGQGNTTGKQNTFVGASAGVLSTSATNNTFVGYQAGKNVTIGNNNIIIGPNSGTAVTDGSDNVILGYNSQAEDGLYNATAIGASSRVAISNALILGNNANVGIGTSAPTTRLEVVSEADNASGLRLSKLTASSPSVQATDQFLTVNERGDVVKARYQLRINNASEWSDKIFAPTYNLRSLGAVEQYIKANNHLPGVPSAEVVAREGVDLVKLNATLLEKIEELTLYSIQLEKADKEHQATSQKQQAEIDELKQLVKQIVNKK